MSRASPRAHHLRVNELEAVLAYLYLVAAPEVDGVDPDPVDVSPVKGARVPDPETPLVGFRAPEDLRVLPGHCDVVEEDGTFGAAAHRHRHVTDVVHPPPRRALDLVELDERRPLGGGVVVMRGYFLLVDDRSVGAGGLRMDQPRPALRAELHLRGDLGAAVGAAIQTLLPAESSWSPSRKTCTSSSGGSAPPPRWTSSPRTRSMLSWRMRRRPTARSSSTNSFKRTLS